ncbi:MAG: hypothetical protein HY259_12685 [Chloroflexi bacterium]|nr:hypothetical protein [Chloroflexota bacterium]MBI3734291.1 hypothetical protein [Chloroflexota bacterium]
MLDAHQLVLARRPVWETGAASAAVVLPLALTRVAATARLSANPVAGAAHQEVEALAKALWCPTGLPSRVKDKAPVLRSVSARASAFPAVDRLPAKCRQKSAVMAEMARYKMTQ